MCCAIYGIRYLKFVHSSTCCDGRRIIFLLNLLLFTMASVTDVEKTYDEWRLIHRCTARGSNFGADIPFYSYLNNATGCASRTIPQDACNTKPRNVSGCDSYYAFVPRGNCQFSVKAYRVQLANYDALIVYSNPGDSPISMDGSKYKDLVKIPVVMVDYNCMERIMKSYQLEVRVIFGYYNLVKYLIPFVCVVVLCFIVLFICLIRVEFHTNFVEHLLNFCIFCLGDSVETCAICLDDFIEGEKLRILPCNHVYHCKCVDPWLTKNRKVCPICKRKILFSGDSDSSDSENERSNTAGTSGTNIHENAPLIANEVQSAANDNVVVRNKRLIRKRFC
uniref:RING-type E3 ubiquitin transferase n=1 Tax=Syphacia muris TaxID=451379 RepID=A0A0N5AN73_9BILA